MGQNSNIEWTDHTFNPWVGCVKVSPGCKHCYAEELMTRKGRWANTWGPAQTSERIKTSDDNWRKPLAWNKQAEKEGRRFKVFCASLADVFEDNDQLYDWRIRLFGLISETPYLDWQILTKRPDFARTFFEKRPHLLMPNVWLGTSVENQEYADKRIPELLKIPAGVRFLSIEPLFGPVSLWGWLSNPLLPAMDYGKEPPLIDWVIVGGESGPNARPMNPEWAQLIRRQCVDAGVAFFFKQWGEMLPCGQEESYNSGWMNREYPIIDAAGHSFYKVGKHAAGRLLDGREWNEMPQAQPTGQMALVDVIENAC